MPDMPDQDVKLGTAADEPKAQDANAPDMNRYWYPPGTTEPQLRPEFANASTAAPTVSTAEPEVKAKVLRGALPEDFPGHGALEAAGLTTYARVRKNLDSLEDLDGIGPATAEKIREAMNESHPDEEEEE